MLLSAFARIPRIFARGSFIFGGKSDGFSSFEVFSVDIMSPMKTHDVRVKIVGYNNQDKGPYDAMVPPCRLYPGT